MLYLLPCPSLDTIRIEAYTQMVKINIFWLHEMKESFMWIGFSAELLTAILPGGEGKLLLGKILRATARSESSLLIYWCCQCFCSLKVKT